MKKAYLFIGFLFLFVHSWGANDYTDFLQKRLNVIAKNADSIVYAHTKELRYQACLDLYDSLDAILYQQESFQLSFDSFKTISVIESKDKRVKIFTWNYFNDSGAYTVYGILQLNPKYFKEFYYPLKALEKTVDTAFAILDADHWFAALYYDIYDYKYKGKCHYLLTGFNGGTTHVNYRVVEHLSLDKRDGPIFGKPIFYGKNIYRRPQSRLIYEHASEATMVCKIEHSQQIIVVSSLVPVHWQRSGDKAYYTPDGTFDYYEFIKGKWFFRDLLTDFKKIGNKELIGDFKTE